MRMHCQRLLVVVLMGVAFQVAVAGEGLEKKLASRLKGEVAELKEAYLGLSVTLERLKIAFPEELAKRVKNMAKGALSVAEELAQQDNENDLRDARKRLNDVRRVRKVMDQVQRRLRNREEEGKAMPEALVAEVNKALTSLNTLVVSRSEGQLVDSARAEGEVRIALLALEQQQVREELTAEFEEILQEFAEIEDDPKIAEIRAQLKRRFAAVQESHELRGEAVRRMLQLDVEEQVLSARREINEELLEDLDRSFEEAEEEIEGLLEQAEAAMDQAEDFEDEGEDDDEDDDGEGDEDDADEAEEDEEDRARDEEEGTRAQEGGVF